MKDETAVVGGQIRAMVGPWGALLCSVVVLPGLGQMLTGRLAKGAVMAGAAALWLPVAMVKLVRDLNQIWPLLLEKTADGQSLALADLQVALSPKTEGFIWLLIPLMVIWLWSAIDAVLFVIRSRSQGGAVRLEKS